VNAALTADALVPSRPRDQIAAAIARSRSDDTAPNAERAIFVSHGAPTIVIDGSPANRFLGGLGAQLGRPRAIVVATAHWSHARADRLRRRAARDDPRFRQFRSAAVHDALRGAGLRRRSPARSRRSCATRACPSRSIRGAASITASGRR
jgi:hypothetical protein